MNEAPRNMTFRDYLRVVRERRLMIAVIILAFGAASFAYSERQPKVFESEAAIQFRVDNVDPTVPITLPGLSPAERAAVAARSVTTDAVAKRAQTLLGTKASLSALRRTVEAHTEAGTLLVIVTAHARTPQAAARIANAFAQGSRDETQAEVRAQYADAANQRRRIITEQLKPAERPFVEANFARLETLALTAEPAVITSTATPPSEPISPRPFRNTILGLLLGVVVALVAASTRDILDRRFANARDIEAALELPIVGFVPEDALGRTVVKANGQKPLDAADFEAIQILVANVELLDIDHPPKIVLVTSALPEEGKSTIAAAMAGAYAALGKPTLLLECDLRNPTLAARLGLKRSPGLTDYLSGNAGLVDVVQSVEFTVPRAASSDGNAAQAESSLSCIVAGSSVPQPVAILRSERAQKFFDVVAGSYEMIVVDATPLLPVADTMHLIPSANAVLMCFRASQTTRNQAGAAKTLLERFPGHPAGIVLTGLRHQEEAELYGSPYVYGGAGKRAR